jgi:predicted transcriptional regulator
MKAIIEVAGPGSAVRAAGQQLAASRLGKAPDFRLGFDSTRALFAEVTPGRLDLLDTLRKAGACSVDALAKAAECHGSNVHTDVARLEELGLTVRNDDSTLCVPFDAVEILLPLARGDVSRGLSLLDRLDRAG